MKKTDQKFLFYLLVSIFLTLGLTISLQPLLADWIEPNAPPPQENMGAPIWNISPDPNDYWLELRTEIHGDFLITDSGRKSGWNWELDYFFASTTYSTFPQIGIGTSSPEAELHIQSYAGECKDPTENDPSAFGSAVENPDYCEDKDYTSMRIENTLGTDSIWELRATHWDDDIPDDPHGSEGHLNNDFAIWGGEDGFEDHRFVIDGGFGNNGARVMIGHTFEGHGTATTVDIMGDIRLRSMSNNHDFIQLKVFDGPGAIDYAEFRWGDEMDTYLRFIHEENDSTEREILTLKPDGIGGKVGINVDDPSETCTVNGSISACGGLLACASDRRLKDVNGDFTFGLDLIMGLNPVYFNFKENNPLNIDSSKEHIGLIAQDLEDIIPEAIIERENGYKTYDPESINWALINAVKEIAEAICVEDPGNEICD